MRFDPLCWRRPATVLKPPYRSLYARRPEWLIDKWQFVHGGDEFGRYCIELHVPGWRPLVVKNEVHKWLRRLRYRYLRYGAIIGWSYRWCRDPSCEECNLPGTVYGRCPNTGWPYLGIVNGEPVCFSECERHHDDDEHQ